MSEPEWTADEIERLRALFDRGQSNGTIGKALGKSRNAVGAKLARLGLRRNCTRDDRAVMTRLIHRQRRAGVTIPVEDMPPEQPRPASVVPLADLEPAQCRFPFGLPGEAAFGFCGGEALPGQSYCFKHHAICYTTAYQPLRSSDMAKTNWKIVKAKRILAEGVE